MKSASLAELKKELKHLEKEELETILLQVVKYKKENKELLSYLLFDADYEEGYIAKVKEAMEQEFQEMNTGNLRAVKKSMQRILRIVKKYIGFSLQKATETELLISYCYLVLRLPVRYLSVTVIRNMLERNYKAILKSIEKLEEDLRTDYNEDIERIQKEIEKIR